MDDAEVLPPLRLGPSLLAVFFGGSLGTLARWAIVRLDPSEPHWVSRMALYPHQATSAWSYVPWWLLLVNTVGVFAAAWLLCGPLRGRSPDDLTRLALITGALGGFTSYSALVLDVRRQWSLSHLASAVTFLGALTAGLLAALAGIKVARR